MQPNQQYPSQHPNTNPTPSLIDSRQAEANAISPAALAAGPAGEGPFTFQSQGMVPMRWSHHRRARSELAFRIPENFDLSSGDPMVNGSFEDVGSEDDFFATFMDIEKIGTKMEESGSGSEGGLFRDWAAENLGAGDERKIDNAKDGLVAATARPKHRHSNSVDDSSMTSSAVARGEGVFGEVLEAKKAMTAEQLEELAVIDPRRAKRVIANRQSAARSKERKARYISELERKVQTLQTEATTLSAQLTLYQRDTTGLTAENVELKLRLQAMEQQARIGDAMNGALKQEVARLKIVTGEASSSSEANNVEQLHTSFNPSFFAIPQQRPSLPYQSIHFQPKPPAANHHILSHPTHFQSDLLQKDPLRRLQGLDISQGSLTVKSVKSESSTISAAESSATF